MIENPKYSNATVISQVIIQMSEKNSTLVMPPNFSPATIKKNSITKKKKTDYLAAQEIFSQMNES